MGYNEDDHRYTPSDHLPQIFSDNPDDWNYVSFPTFPTIRGKIDFKKPVPIETWLEGRDSTPRQVLDVRAQFMDQEFNPKAIRMNFEDGVIVAEPNRSIINPSKEPIMRFIYNNEDYVQAATTDFKDADNVKTLIQQLAIIGGGAAAASGTRRRNRQQLSNFKSQEDREDALGYGDKWDSPFKLLFPPNTKRINSTESSDIINQVWGTKRTEISPRSGSKYWYHGNGLKLKKGGPFDPDKLDPNYMYTGSGDIARDKAGRPISSAEQVKEDILSGVLPKPTLEQLEQASLGGGAQNKAGWIYNRNRVAGFTTTVRDRLLAEYGGTPALAEQFRKEQLAHQRYMNKKVIPELNSQARLAFLIFFSTAREIGGKDLPAFTTDMTWENAVFDMFQRFLASPAGQSAVYDLGHKGKSAFNVNIHSTKPTTADFASNLEPEMKRSMKDFIMQEAKSGGLVREGLKRPINQNQQDIKALRVVEEGNIKRGKDKDLPALFNLWRNVNPNVELEYVRWLSKHGHDAEGGKNYDKFLTDIIDPMEEEALLIHIRKYIRKKQNKASGEKQLRLYPKWLRAAIDDYMNTRYKTKAQLDVEHEAGQTLDASQKEAQIWAEQQAERGKQVLQEDLSIKEALKDMPSEKQMESMLDNWLEGIRPEDIEE